MYKVTFLPKHFPYKYIFSHYFATIFLVALLSTSGLISCSSSVQNRQRIPKSETADQIIVEMKSVLNLTPDQEINIRPIIEEQAKKRKALIDKYQGRNCQGPDCLKDQLKDLRISTESQLQYFLTNDQMIKYGYMQQEEDQRIMKTTSEKTQEEVSQEKPEGRDHRSRGF